MDRITDEQVQELTNSIADKCEEMGLDAEQTLDGIARTLIAAANTFEVSELTIRIDDVGLCKVELSNEVNSTS